MHKTKLYSILFGVLSIILAGYLFYSIKSTIDETNNIKEVEAKVIKQLIMIREAQLAYKAVNGQFTSDWNKLLNFVDSGKFYLTERKETIITLAYGVDSTYVEIDTLGSVFVKDSLFTKYPNFKIATLKYVPETEPQVEFKMWTEKANKSGVLVDLIEVWDPKPINPNRKEDSEFNTKKPLRFGSRTNVTTAGNWE